jgi:hypothetical protein
VYRRTVGGQEDNRRAGGQLVGRRTVGGQEDSWGTGGQLVTTGMRGTGGHLREHRGTIGRQENSWGTGGQLTGRMTVGGQEDSCK